MGNRKGTVQVKIDMTDGRIRRFCYHCNAPVDIKLDACPYCDCYYRYNTELERYALSLKAQMQPTISCPYSKNLEDKI